MSNGQAVLSLMRIVDGASLFLSPHIMAGAGTYPHDEDKEEVRPGPFI